MQCELAEWPNEEVVACCRRKQSGQQTRPAASVYRRNRDAGKEQDERRQILLRHGQALDQRHGCNSQDGDPVAHRR